MEFVDLEQFDVAGGIVGGVWMQSIPILTRSR